MRDSGTNQYPIALTLAWQENAVSVVPETGEAPAVAQEKAPPASIVTMWEWLPCCGTLVTCSILLALVYSYMSSVRRGMREMHETDLQRARMLAEREMKGLQKGGSGDPWSEAGRRLDPDEDQPPRLFPPQSDSDGPDIPPDDRIET